MRHYIISPEVGGEIGEDSVVDLAKRPPEVEKLQYLFHGWLGDCIVESVAVYIVTGSAAAELEESGLTGFRTADVDVVTSEEFAELQADVELPPFRWLIIEGTEGSDDFFMVGRVKLAVSEAALSVLKRHGLRFAELTPLSSVHSC